MSKVIQLKLNNQVVEITNTADLGLRLSRIAQSRDNLAVKGSDFSTSITLPKTKTNQRFFVNKDLLAGNNKFNALADYIAEILVDGQSIILGTFRLSNISSRGYQGEIKSASGNWISLIDSLQLNELGLVDGVPTWFFPFEGAPTINSANNAAINESLYRFPVVVYNNTPLIDYYNIPSVDIFGEYDLSCTQLVSPKDFPNDFPLRNGYFGWRDGLTFEDFPGAINYGDLIRKCFSEIGWNASGSIFNEDWFKSLIIAHTGDDFKYNWKTLGYLFTDLVIDTQSEPFENGATVYLTNPTLTLGYMHTPSIGSKDDISTRIDRVTNFRKYLVTDVNTGTFTDGGYVCPTNGRYKIRIKSYYAKNMAPTDAFFAGFIDEFGGNTADYAWDDNALLITRRDDSGDFVFDYPELQFPAGQADFRSSAALWMNNESTDFVTLPSDVIAYISPKRYNNLGNVIAATGSPLTNWTEPVTVISSVHNILSNTIVSKISESSCEIEITLDFKKNERINFYWESLIFGPASNVTTSAQAQINNAASEIEIEYLCGYEDLDVASNLPAIGVKEFIGSFINQFNLRFDVVEGTNTVSFISPNTLFAPDVSAYVIDDRVEYESIQISTPNAPKKLTIGYNNDNGDRLLTTDSSNCDFINSTQLSNYGNVVLTPNSNIYGTGDLNVKSIFSATKFVDGSFELMDITGGSFGNTRTNSYPDCNGYPALIDDYWRYNDLTSLTYQVPSIQSRESYDQSVLGDLEYSYKYTPRVLYYLGTAAQYLGANPNDRIKIDSRGITSGKEIFTIEPTVLAFDTENSNPYNSLRYDTYLYNAYFDNLIEYYNKSYILDCQVALRGSDWRELRANRLVSLYGNLYRLLEIKDYDPLEENLVQLTLMKVI